MFNTDNELPMRMELCTDIASPICKESSASPNIGNEFPVRETAGKDIGATIGTKSNNDLELHKRACPNTPNELPARQKLPKDMVDPILPRLRTDMEVPKRARPSIDNERSICKKLCEYMLASI